MQASLTKNKDNLNNCLQKEYSDKNLEKCLQEFKTNVIRDTSNDIKGLLNQLK